MRSDTFLEYLIENGVLPVALDKQPSGNLQAHMKISTQKMKTCYSVPMQYSFTEAMKISHEAMKSKPFSLLRSGNSKSCVQTEHQGKYSTNLLKLLRISAPEDLTVGVILLELLHSYSKSFQFGRKTDSKQFASSTQKC